MDQHSHEYRQGLASRDAGESFSANPYQAGTRECSDWFKGWEAADDFYASAEQAADMERRALNDAEALDPDDEPTFGVPGAGTTTDGGM